MHKYSTFTVRAWQGYFSRSAFVALLLLIVIVPARAAPAAWYWWTSKLDGQRVCLQTSPGHGWFRDSAPYRDAGCRKPATR